MLDCTADHQTALAGPAYAAVRHALKLCPTFFPNHPNTKTITHLRYLTAQQTWQKPGPCNLEASAGVLRRATLP